MTTKYLFLLYGPPIPEPGTEAARQLIESWTTATEAMAKAGVLIDCAATAAGPANSAATSAASTHPGRPAR